MYEAFSYCRQVLVTSTLKKTAKTKRKHKARATKPTTQKLSQIAPNNRTMPNTPGRNQGETRRSDTPARSVPTAPSRSACLHTSAYVSIRQRTSAYVSIRQHTSAYVSIRQHLRHTHHFLKHTSAYASICQHTPAYVSICQHTSAYVSIRQHTSRGIHATFCHVTCTSLSPPDSRE